MSQQQQDDSFFAPSAATGAVHSRARAMFGLPGDPTASRGAPTHFDDDYSYEDESFSYHNHHQAHQARLAGELELELGDESMEYADADLHQEASQIEPSSEAYQGYDTSGADYSQEHDHDVSHDHEGEAGDTTYPDSDLSSDIDPDDDPAGWADRLDEIAGTLEMSEAEARALRWGPAIGSQADNVRQPLADLHRLVDHHLTATEWRFCHRAGGAPGLDAGAEEHPNRVIGRGWIGHEAGRRMDPLTALRQTLLDTGYGTGKVP